MATDDNESEIEKEAEEYGVFRLQDSLSLDTVSSDGAAIRSHTSVRQELQQFLRSTRCQVMIVSLVVIDTVLVITELLFDLEMDGQVSSVPFVLHTLSLSLLALFIVEIFLRIYAYHFDFFTRKGDLFDTIVVIIAICLDAVYLHSHDAHSGVGLIIVLRLWRVIRIQNAMVLQVRKTGERHLIHEHKRRIHAEQILERYRSYSYAQEAYIKHLEEILIRNEISFQEECKNRPDFNRICAEAEMNVRQ